MARGPQPHHGNQWSRFFFGSPLKALITTAVIAIAVLAIWAQFDQAAVQHLINNIWALIWHIVSIALVIGLVLVGFKLVLFGGPKKKGH